MSVSVYLVPIAVEGAVARFVGRPRNQNPYSPAAARAHFEMWAWGWDGADELLEIRGSAEAARWLREAA
jgi:hypothetical protein